MSYQTIVDFDIRFTQLQTFSYIITNFFHNEELPDWFVDILEDFRFEVVKADVRGVGKTRILCDKLTHETMGADICQMTMFNLVSNDRYCGDGDLSDKAQLRIDREWAGSEKLGMFDSDIKWDNDDPYWDED